MVGNHKVFEKFYLFFLENKIVVVTKVDQCISILSLQEIVWNLEILRFESIIIITINDLRLFTNSL